MRILPIQYSHNKPNFNGKYKVPEPFRLGDAADERIYIYISALRKHIFENAFPPEGLYNGRLEEYPMNRFLKELLPPVVRNKGLSEAELKKLSTYNIFKVEGTRNTYGGPIQYYDLDILKPLNLEKIYAGRIIHKFITEYNNGVLVDFIKRMQADNVYVCCSFGYRETHQALMLNQYLNPLSKDKREYDTGMRFALLSNMLDFCDEVTLAQKKKIGWTEEFETNLRKKLNKEIDRYCKL